MPYFEKWKDAIKGITPKIEIPDVEVPEMKVPDFPISDTPITAITIPEISATQTPQGSVEMAEPISMDIEALESIIPDIETPSIPDKLEREIPIPKTDIPDIRVLPPPEELKRYIPIPNVEIPDIRVLPLPEQLTRMVSISEAIIPDILIQKMDTPMMYIRDIKIISKPSMPIISIPNVTEYNIFRQVQELIKWKEEFANPNILSNVGNIESIYRDIKNNMIPNIEANIKNITSIYDDLKNNVAPNINKAKDLAISAMESSIINMNNIKSIYIDLKDNIVPSVNKARDLAISAMESSIINMNNISSIYSDLKDNIAPSVNKAKDLAISAMETSIINMDNISAVYTELRDNIVPTINKAKEVALLAADNAQKAVDYAKGFILKLQLAGEIIAYGIEDLNFNANELYRIITVEVEELSDSYKDFGLVIQTGVTNIITELKELAGEMIEFATEVKPALSAAASNAQSAAAARSKIEDDLYDLSRHIRDLKWDRAYDDIGDLKRHLNTFVRDAGDAIAYLTFRGADGHSAVLPEVVEGLNEVGREATQLSSAVFNFGLNLYHSSHALAEQNRNSFNTIRRQVNVFSNSFLRIFTDLHTVFTREYTSQEIAEEQTRRRAEREKYISFTVGIQTYEKGITECETSKITISNKEAELIAAQERLETAKTHIDPIAAKSEIELQQKNMNYWNTVISNQFGSVSQLRSNLRQSYITSIGKDKFNGYYLDYQPKDIHGYRIPPVSVLDNLTDSVKHNITVGRTMYVVRTGTGMLDFKVLNVSTLWANRDRMHKYDIAEYNYKIAVIDYNEAKRIAETQLVQEQEAVAIAQTEYNTAVQNSERICGNVSQYRQDFTAKYGVTPEEGDLLTYEEIIQKT